MIFAIYRQSGGEQCSSPSPTRTRLPRTVPLTMWFRRAPRSRRVGREVRNESSWEREDDEGRWTMSLYRAVLASRSAGKRNERKPRQAKQASRRTRDASGIKTPLALLHCTTAMHLQNTVVAFKEQQQGPNPSREYTEL